MAFSLRRQFAAPTFGSEGNEKAGQFRGPNFAETDINFYKDTRITERVNFQFRFEVFNLFNRANLSNCRYPFAGWKFRQSDGSPYPQILATGRQDFVLSLRKADQTAGPFT